MTTHELARETSLRTGYTISVCYEILHEMFKVMSDTLEAYEDVKIPHFGTFSVYDRKPRNRYNHQTKQVDFHDGYKYPKFIPSAHLKQVVKS